MIKKAKHYFNTSGPNIQARHYTLERAFVPNTVKLSNIKEQVETVGGITIGTYIVQYDEEKDF